MAAREIMDFIGMGQKYSNEIIGKVHRIGNNLGLPGPALEDTLLGLEEDVKEDTGADVKYPLDVQGAEVLLVTPSADFFAEPHVDSLIGYGKVELLEAEAAQKGLGLLMEHCGEPGYVCSAEVVAITAVNRVILDEVTGKRRNLKDPNA